MNDTNIEYNLRRVAEALIHIECGTSVPLGYVAAGALDDLCKAAMEFEDSKGNPIDLRRNYEEDEGLPKFYNDFMFENDKAGAEEGI